MYPKVSGLASWRENCEWYSSLPLGAVVSFVSFAAMILCVASLFLLLLLRSHFP
jgi:diadenosine tetraphosphatase ApaH/serine/threonine PP2A family protein phosphatase